MTRSVIEYHYTMTGDIMFLPKKYILGVELTEKMGISRGNVSMVRKKFEHDDDLYSIRKLNNCLMINKNARNLPNNFREAIDSNTFTDMSNLLPRTYVRQELQLTEADLVSAGVVAGLVDVCGKTFYVFNREFADRVNQHTPYILTMDEHDDCVKRGQILGSVKLRSNKYLAWY